MKAVYADPKGKKAMIAFVDETDNAVFPAELFGLDRFYYGDLKELVPTFVGIEMFLNWNKFEYRVGDEEVTISQMQASLKAADIERMTYRRDERGKEISGSGAYSQIEAYWRYSSRSGEILKGRQRRRMVVIEGRDRETGEKKYKQKFLTSGLFVSDGYKHRLQLLQDSGYTRITLRGYTENATNIKTRVVVYRGKYRQAAGIADGGQLHDYFSPFEDHYMILEDGEAEPVACRVYTNNHAEIAKKWQKEKNGWIITANWILNLSRMFDIPRAELMAHFAKDCKTGSPKEFLAAVKKLHKRLGSKHTIMCHILIKDLYKRLREEKTVHIKEWAEVLKIVKPADETNVKELATKSLWLSFKYTLKDYLLRANAEKDAQHHIPMMQANGNMVRKNSGTYENQYTLVKTPYLLAIDEAWKAFAADIRAVI